MTQVFKVLPLLDINWRTKGVKPKRRPQNHGLHTYARHKIPREQIEALRAWNRTLPMEECYLRAEALGWGMSRTYMYQVMVYLIRLNG